VERGDWGLDLVLKSGERKVAIEPDSGRWKAGSGKCGLNPIVKSGEWEVVLILIGSGKWKWEMVVGCDLHFLGGWAGLRGGRNPGYTGTPTNPDLNYRRVTTQLKKLCRWQRSE
jgi:hypothetical protein